MWGIYPLVKQGIGNFACTQLILDKPFLGNLVLRLPLVAADSWCKTSATDAKSFYYNPEFIDSLNNHQISSAIMPEYC
jgi:hypothetical protein